MNGILKSDDLSSTDKREILQKMWNQGTEPIVKHGFIISLQMTELSNRRYTNAAPYFKQIAETELPQELGMPTQARIKSRYQNPAAEAWVRIKMPKELTDDEQKIWLTDFIENEKKLGEEGKQWAIEAARRIMWNIDVFPMASPRELVLP